MSSQTFSGESPVAVLPASRAPIRRQEATSRAKEQIATLTGRELEVFRFVAEGMTNKRVGRQLSVSPITVRHHLTSIFQKLSLQNRFELIVLSYEAQLPVRPVVRGPALYAVGSVEDRNPPSRVHRKAVRE
jgi:DNA-binding NarL/FixJ family response regulator